MIFHEIYSAYYNAVAKILSALIQEERTEKELQSGSFSFYRKKMVPYETG